MNRCKNNLDIENFKDSIKNLSFDKDNKVFLCNYKNKFLNFEEIVKLKNKKELPKAVDMLYINDEKKEIWFVEFKNMDKNKVEKNKKYDVKRKILDSLIFFYEICCQENIFCDYKKNYFVVYKCDYKDIHDELYSYVEELEIYFELEEIKNKFLDEVITQCCDFFLKEFTKRFNIKWEGA
jgi:hypothetical protein